MASTDGQDWSRNDRGERRRHPIFYRPASQMGTMWGGATFNPATHAALQIDFSDKIEGTDSQNQPYDPDGRLANYLAYHELGHLVGFDDAGCSPDQTVMVGTIPEDAAWILQHIPAQPVLTSTDISAVTANPPPSGGGGEDDPPDEDGECDPTYPCSPLLLDFDGGRTEMSEPNVPFDFWGDGHLTLFSWPLRRSPSAWLVLDRNGDGIVNSGRELFGNATALSWGDDGPRAPDGFAALAWFDRPENGGNGDGWLSEADAIWQNLRLWRDLNHDGVSTATEMQSPGDSGVVRIGLHPKEKHRIDSYGNHFALRADFFYLDGRGKERSSLVWDVYLAHR